MRKRKEKVVRRKCCVDCAALEDEEQEDDPYLTATGKPFVINKEGQENLRKFLSKQEPLTSRYNGPGINRNSPILNLKSKSILDFVILNYGNN